MKTAPLGKTLEIKASALDVSGYEIGLRALSSVHLVQTLKTLVQEERRLLVQVLQCLREIERRMLYAERGYGSLYEFCVQELGYSESTAYRRISSMRLLKTLPEETRVETERKLKTGELSLTSVSQLQGFFQAERRERKKEYTPEEKSHWLKQAEGVSKRDLERKLAKIQPAIQSAERERLLGPDEVEIRFVASAELVRKFTRLRGFLAHRGFSTTYAQLFETISDLAIQQLDPASPLKPKKPAMSLAPEKQVANPPEDPSARLESGRVLSESRAISTESRATPFEGRAIPSEIRRSVWRRDQGQCTYSDPVTKRRCTSRYRLEVDHIQPFALGGDHSLENLRLLCRTHNTYAAERVFGKSFRSNHA